jgi:hypothetical protein
MISRNENGNGLNPKIFAIGVKGKINATTTIARVVNNRSSPD